MFVIKLSAGIWINLKMFLSCLPQVKKNLENKLSISFDDNATLEGCLENVVTRFV